MATKRIRDLVGRYPDRFRPGALDRAYSLPQDVNKIGLEDLKKLNVLKHRRVLVTAGFPCQDLSGAAHRETKGLSGIRSGTFWPIAHLLKDVQRWRLANDLMPIGWILENVNMQHVTGPNQTVAQAAFKELCEILGPAVSFDAAAAGSRCHRVRNWWSNVWDPVTVQHVFNEVHRLKLRPAVKPVQSVLRAGWKAPRAKMTGPPYYPCNGLEVEREALPTLVTYELSHAFR